MEGAQTSRSLGWFACKQALPGWVAGECEAAPPTDVPAHARCPAARPSIHSPAHSCCSTRPACWCDRCRPAGRMGEGRGTPLEQPACARQVRTANPRPSSPSCLQLRRQRGQVQEDVLGLAHHRGAAGQLALGVDELGGIEQGPAGVALQCKERLGRAHVRVSLRIPGVDARGWAGNGRHRVAVGQRRTAVPAWLQRCPDGCSRRGRRGSKPPATRLAPHLVAPCILVLALGAGADHKTAEGASRDSL